MHISIFVERERERELGLREKSASLDCPTRLYSSSQIRGEREGGNKKEFIWIGKTFEGSELGLFAE